MTSAQAEILRRLDLRDAQGRRAAGVILLSGAEVSAARALERKGECAVERRSPAHPSCAPGCSAFYAMRRDAVREP